MILGISGKIGSGKDLVGKIVQILTSFPNMSVERVLEHLDRKLHNVVFENKKFADSLKDMVCILLGCTRKQLEDREFKEKELGEEWWYFQLQKQVGYGSVMIPYLGNEKEIPRLTLHKLTPRLLLQLLGTECGRNIIHPNIWVNALFTEYRLYGEVKPFANKTLKDDEYPKWVITDMRFLNELKAIEDRGGITIRVNRDNCICDFKEATYCDKKCRIDRNYKEHPSETALDNAKFAHTIINDGTIEDLVKKIREILIKENIIKDALPKF